MNKNNIIAVLNGGLGNQLFIFAAVQKILKLTKRKEICFLTHRHFLDRYINISHFIKNIEFKKLSKNRFLYNIQILLKYRIFSKNVSDNTNLNKKNLFQNQIFIDGYFQKKKWYFDVLDDVKDKIFTKNFKKKLKQFPIYDVVLSFRRGDYVQHGFALNLDYYFLSLKKLKVKKYDNIKIVCDDYEFELFFSDLLKQKGYKVSEPIKYKSSRKKSIYDFFTLIKSRKLIMSNSTFCWWAAILRDKLNFSSSNVTSPKKWFPKVYSSSLNFDHPGNPLGWLSIKNTFKKF